jgi:hypothetical protein
MNERATTRPNPTPTDQLNVAPVILKFRRRCRVVVLPYVVMNDTRASMALAAGDAAVAPGLALAVEATEPDRLAVNGD